MTLAPVALLVKLPCTLLCTSSQASSRSSLGSFQDRKKEEKLETVRKVAKRLLESGRGNARAQNSRVAYMEASQIVAKALNLSSSAELLSSSSSSMRNSDDKSKLPEEVMADINSKVERRLAGEPLGYVLGER